MSRMYLGQHGATKFAARVGTELPAYLQFPHPDVCTIKHEHHAQVLKLMQETVTAKVKEPEVRKFY